MPAQPGASLTLTHNRLRLGEQTFHGLNSAGANSLSVIEHQSRFSCTEFPTFEGQEDPRGREGLVGGGWPPGR